MNEVIVVRKNEQPDLFNYVVQNKYFYKYANDEHTWVYCYPEKLEEAQKDIWRKVNKYENFINLLRASSFLLSTHNEGYAENNLVKDINEAIKEEK